MNDPEIDDEVLELTDELEDDLVQADEGDEREEGEQSPDNSTIRKMRAELREAKRRNAELEKAQKATTKVDPGPKPTLESCDWLDDKYEAELERWTQAKLAAEKQEPVQNETATKFEASANAFQAARVALTAEQPEAEDVILDVDKAIGVERSGFLIHAFKDKAPALMVEIGKNPDLMDEIADMDPVEMIVRVAQLQTKEARVARPKPDIDEPVMGKPPVRRGADKQLEKLESEADKTGDRTKLIAYKKRLRESGRA
jgi:hypothetical protein